MTRRNKKRSFKSSNLNFQVLEPRQLLAGDLLGPHQVGGSLPESINVIPNGDFETVTPGSDNFYAESEVASWETKGLNTQLNIFDYSADYGNVLDLDSTVAEFDRVYQDIPTVAGRDYLVTFDFRSHTVTPNDASARTNDFEVWWGGTLMAIYTGGDIWQTGTIRVTAGASATTELLFCEVLENGQSDGIGALLDNIRVFQANEYELTNGGFENATATGVFNRPFEVEGWGAMGADINDRWLKIVPTGENATATEGQRYLNLDATDETRDIVFRDLETTPGSNYYITFDMRTDGNTNVESDEVRVRWNENWATTILADSDWQNYGLMVTADSAETRLTFLEPTLGDGSGPLIDNVRIFTVLENDIQLDANGAAEGTTRDTTFFPGAGSQNIGGEISLTHPANDRISSATITLNGVVDGNSEIIAIAESTIPSANGNPKITVFGYRPETRQLQLVGVATAAEYQTVLRSLSYFNAKDDLTTTNRSVAVTVFNNNLPPANSSASAVINVAVETDQAAIDDAILQKFIADNDLDAQPVTEGLYAVIDEPGSGQNPTINSTVRVAYTGKFITLNEQNKLVEGDTFDSSSEAGVSFPLSNVIRGWQLGIPEYKTGGTGKLLIPSHLAYGPVGTGSGSIPPNTVLIFDVDLKQII